MIQETQAVANGSGVLGGGLDRDVALSRVGGDVELLQEIAQLFLDDSASYAVGNLESS